MPEKEGILYFKMVVSYGKPTEYDAVGCDGLYIKSCEQVNDEIAQLEAKIVSYRKAYEQAVETAWLGANIRLIDLDDMLIWIEEKGI